MHNLIRLSHGKSVLDDGPALLIAEVSANHDHDLDQALALVDIAADAGWHCLKLQTYTADSLSVPSDHPSTKIDQIWEQKIYMNFTRMPPCQWNFTNPCLIELMNAG